MRGVRQRKSQIARFREPSLGESLTSWESRNSMKLARNLITKHAQLILLWSRRHPKPKNQVWCKKRIIVNMLLLAWWIYIGEFVLTSRPWNSSTWHREGGGQDCGAWGGAHGCGAEVGLGNLRGSMVKLRVARFECTKILRTHGICLKNKLLDNLQFLMDHQFSLFHQLWFHQALAH